MNLKFFPITLIHDRNGGIRKVPLIDDWKNRATSDQEQLAKWTEQFGERIKFWAVPTGRSTGIYALDIDVKSGGFETIKQFHLPETMSQTTLSGGKHFLFKYPEDGKIYGNTVGFLPGLDTRGESGYIGWYDSLEGTTLADPPAWIFDKIKSKKQIDVTQINTNFKISESIIKEHLDASMDRIVNAPPGESNNILNAESYLMGQIVKQSNVPEETIKQQLLEAALERGKPYREAIATINSGIDGGKGLPIGCPFPNSPPPVPKFIHVPKLDTTPEDWSPEGLTLFDLTDKNVLRKPQLFKNWSTEDIHLTTADGGTGKTTLKLFEAICLALGEPFLGFTNLKRGKTLFITGEDTKEKLAATLGQICEQMGLFKGTEETNYKLNLILDSIIIKKDSEMCIVKRNQDGFLELNGDALDQVKATVDKYEPKMIVFDPIVSFWGPESMVNDMTRVVAKFMSELVSYSNACVEMINHMGKSSSSGRDMSQFAGRGGTALPSQSRVSRVMRRVGDDEYKEMMGVDLEKGETALLCNVNKFTDGSPLLDVPFLIIRKGYLFSRRAIQKVSSEEEDVNYSKVVLDFVKSERSLGRYPTHEITQHQIAETKKISKAKVKHILSMLSYQGLKGEFVRTIDNPNPDIRDKGLIVTNVDGDELR